MIDLSKIARDIANNSCESGNPPREEMVVRGLCSRGLIKAFIFVEHLKRLGLYKDEITEEGRKFIHYGEKIASLVKKSQKDFWDDRGYVLGAVLLALIDWQSQFKSAEDFLENVDKVSKKIALLLKNHPKAFERLMFLITRYDFSEGCNIHCLIQKLLKFY